MTCIVGIITKDSVIIGADSAGVSGLDITVRKDPKVFIKDDFIIGCTSSYRMMNLLQYSLKIKKRPPEMDIHEYMCTIFINSVRKTFRKGGYLQSTTDGEEQGGIFLVGYQGRLFRIDSDFHVGESVDEYEAIGCGENYAKASLYESSNERSNIVFNDGGRINKALETAEKFSAGVCSPFILKSIGKI